MHDGPYISLVTFRRDGSEVATPVWFAPLGDKLYVFTDGTSYKVKRLRRDDRIRIAPCGVAGALEGDWISGRGRVVEDRDLVAQAYRALGAKYGWQMSAINFLSRLSGRIKRRVILELDIDAPS